MAGSSVISLPRAKVRSSVRCGRLVWPPLPPSRTNSESAAPVSGPSRRPRRPTSRLGSQCRPKTWCDVVERAGLDQVQRSPGHDLLGRLEEQPDAAGQQAARVRPRRGPGAAPTRPAVCTSWPQAWATPGTVLAHGSLVRSSTGSASRSARSATSRSARAELADQPAAVDGRELPAGVGRAPRSPCRWCVTRSTPARGGRAGHAGSRSAGRRTSRRPSRCGSMSVVGESPAWVSDMIPSSVVEATGPLRAVLRRRTPRGSGRRPPGRAARRPARRARTSSRIAAHAGRAAQPLVELVAHQRPGEVELLARRAWRPARPRRGARGGRAPAAQTSSTPTSLRPEQVTTGGAHSPLAAHQPQRAGELAGRGPGLLLAVAVGLVDRDHVGDLEDALLDALQLVAGAGEGEEQERVDHPGDGDLGLADADGLDQHDVVRRPPRAPHRLGGRAGDAAEGAGRGRGPDVGVAGRRTASPSGSCRRAPSRRCARWTGRRRARRPGGRRAVSRVPSASMNVDLPTPGTPEMPTRTAVEPAGVVGQRGRAARARPPGARAWTTRPA